MQPSCAYFAILQFSNDSNDGSQIIVFFLGLFYACFLTLRPIADSVLGSTCVRNDLEQSSHARYNS